ncbi:tRNA adenosine(34) deaminase TadA [Clostridium sp. D2Q-14]|uniref:tRNA adenosine(34) deaminase TadA n=1 Tax=Anaeromonas gelatinilytica TaxID=2683194 RepID=UPI00193AEC51|nr:tRNA adenosine(34) deaminase TadA [Anaeromonas gelatinilytica]MBS4534006.1 tRNA adenosine(34) deaminase TadA [Anaeromonas gelatinilytica]
MEKYFMKRALKEAKLAYDLEEVPIGCVIVKCNKIIASAHNFRESLNDPTAHAEILAIQDAADYLGGWRLSGCTMYVTIEPCPMCAGAIVNSRIDRLVIGAPDLKGGGCGSIFNIVDNDKLNHRVDVVWGVLEEESSKIMKDFFKELRKRK